jgi:apolipoprotein N-acyltransferase
MHPQKWHLCLLALASGVLLPLALPSDLIGGAIRLLGFTPGEGLFWGNAVLGLVAIAPVFYAVSLAPTSRFASLLGLIFGAVSTALSSFWLMYFQGFTVWTYGGTIAGYMGYNALLFPFLRAFSRMGRRWRPFLLAGAWALYEYFKSVGFLGYPWGLISYPVGGVLPLIQVVDVTGVWGLSFLMALLNALVAEYALVSWRPSARPLFLRQAGFGIFVVACVLGYGIYRLATPIPYSTTASLLLVQQNMNPWIQGQGNEESFQANAALTLAGVRAATRPPDLAVWSESSVSNVGVNLDGSYWPAKNNLVPAIQASDIPVLFGGFVIVNLRQGLAMNAAILADGSGKVLDTYGKMHPVPFAESIPFFEVPWVQSFFRHVVGIELPWVSGTRYTTFHVPLQAGGQLSFGVPICFEDAFSNLVRGYINHGADMLVNITDDSWSKTWSAEIQHFVAARFRAVENRRVLVRSTNGGLSTVVGPWGEMLTQLPFFERTWKAIDVPVYKEKVKTIYTRFGDWFAWALMGALLAVLVASSIPKKRRLPFHGNPWS